MLADNGEALLGDLQTVERLEACDLAATQAACTEWLGSATIALTFVKSIAQRLAERGETPRGLDVDVALRNRTSYDD